ncbi:unnamed protein product [Penicillium nalgiovense]|nr:unnamed protein product [Penicillium nalgiovense]
MLSNGFWTSSGTQGSGFGRPEPERLYAAPPRHSKQTLGNGQFAPESPPCQRELQRQRWQYATLAVHLLLLRRITERLLAEKDINVNFVGGRRRFVTPSTLLHHAATRLDTVLVRRLLAIPGIARNLCVAGHSPISVAAYHGLVNTVACLLGMEDVEINGMDVINPPICRAVAHGHLDVVSLLVQQGARLKINESTITTHDTVLCIAARGGDLQMIQVLLRHGEIDVNRRNQWFEDPLMLAAKGGHYSIVNALVVNPRLTHFSLKRSLDLARDDCMQRAIRTRMEDDNTPQTLLKRSSRRRFGGL